MADRTRRGLGGMGLSGLLSPTVESGEEHPDLRRIPLDLIAPNPRQPRTEFDEGALAALADSLRTRGVLQPVLVRPVPGGTYELIAGERRWRAAQAAGLEAIPALVRPHDDADSLEIALIENMAREDLNPIEEARACALLVEELGLTREELGLRVGRSRAAVSNLMRLLDLPDEALDLIATGQLSEGHGRALLLASDHADRRRLALRAVAEEWTVRRLEEAARSTNDRTPAAPRRAAQALHPDQEAAAARIVEVLGRAFGADVKATPAADGYRVSFTVSTPDDAAALAERLGERSEAP